MERSSRPEDRRRISARATERGQQVVAAVIRAVDAVDEQLRERVPGRAGGGHARRLRALKEIKSAGGGAGARPRRDRRRAAPVQPDLPGRRPGRGARALRGTRLFTTAAYEDGGDYRFADRDGTGLHLAAAAGHDPARGSAAYLYVRDADALYGEWTRPGIGGRHRAARPDALGGMREGSHADPDGNLIRFGSPLAEPSSAPSGAGSAERYTWAVAVTEARSLPCRSASCSRRPRSAPTSAGSAPTPSESRSSGTPTCSPTTTCSAPTRPCTRGGAASTT